MSTKISKPNCMHRETLPNEPTQQRGFERRRRILDAGLNLFGKLGYERTRVEDLAKAAGASTAIVYRYFTSKRQILLFLMNEYLVRLSSLRLEHVEHGADPLVMAEALLRQSLVAETPYAGMWRAWREAVRTDPTLRPLHKRVNSWVLDYTATVYRTAQDQGIASKRVDADALAFATDTLIWALAELPKREQDVLLPQLARLLVYPLSPGPIADA